MLVEICLRCLPIFLWDAAKHKPAVYRNAHHQVVMNSLQPGFSISDTVIVMPITVAWKVETNALPRAQSVTPLVLSIVGMKHQMVDVNDVGFLLPETENSAMTLTPPLAGQRDVASSGAGALGNRPETNRIRIGCRSNKDRITVEQKSNATRKKIKPQSNPN